MDILLRMNKKLDVGWKLTNSDCEKCRGVTMTDPNNRTQYYCPKCDKNYEFEFQEDNQDDINQQKKEQNNDNHEDEDYFNEVIAESGLFKKPIVQDNQLAPGPAQTTPSGEVPQPIQAPSVPTQRMQRTNNVSKKLGEKLLQGWTMLQQACLECNVPLMKSKKGEKICFGCDKDYAAIQAQKQQQKKNAQQLKSQAPQTKPQQKPVIQYPQPQMSSNLPVPSSYLPPTVIQNSQPGISSSSQTTVSLLIQNIEWKGLKFLQQKLDKAITQNDLSSVEKILSIVKSMKN